MRGWHGLVVSLALLTTLPAPAARACGIELILAVDVSRSVVESEYRLQMEGIGAAFQHPDVGNAIRWVAGGVMVSVTQWSGPDEQDLVVPWTHVTDEADSARLGIAIAAAPRAYANSFTAIGAALRHARAVSADNPRPCLRRVIDVSGDGANNRWPIPAPIADSLEAEGYIINGLVIAGAKPDPVAFYEEQVVRGPGSFIEIADGFEDYPRAMLRKLLRELAPAVSMR